VTAAGVTRRSKPQKAPFEDQQDSTQDVRVPISKEHYRQLQELKRDTRIPIGVLVDELIAWGLHTKADAIRKWAEGCPFPRRDRD
jgi:hypothetical protein